MFKSVVRPQDFMLSLDVESAYSHAALPLGWTRSTRIWTRVMSVVGAVLHIVRVTLKGCFDTPTQTLPDHLGFIISRIDKGALRVPERRSFALWHQARALLFETVKNRRQVDSDLLCDSRVHPSLVCQRFH